MRDKKIVEKRNDLLNQVEKLLSDIDVLDSKLGVNQRLVVKAAGPYPLLDWCEMDYRVYNTLKKSGFIGLAEFKSMTDEEILEIPGIGRFGLFEIRWLLDFHSL